MKVWLAYAHSNIPYLLLALDEKLEVSKGRVRQEQGNAGYMHVAGWSEKQGTIEQGWDVLQSNRVNMSVLSPTTRKSKVQLCLPWTINYSMSIYFKHVFPSKYKKAINGKWQVCWWWWNSPHIFYIMWHVDCGDESVGISMWVEKQQGKANIGIYLTLYKRPWECHQGNFSYTFTWPGNLVGWSSDSLLYFSDWPRWQQPCLL